MNLNNGLDESSGDPISHHAFVHVTTGVVSSIACSVALIVVWMQRTGMLVN
jgi:hypothetical protein